MMLLTRANIQEVVSLEASCNFLRRMVDSQAGTKPVWWNNSTNRGGWETGTRKEVEYTRIHRGCQHVSRGSQKRCRQTMGAGE